MNWQTFLIWDMLPALFWLDVLVSWWRKKPSMFVRLLNHLMTRRRRLTRRRAHRIRMGVRWARIDTAEWCDDMFQRIANNLDRPLTYSRQPGKVSAGVKMRGITRIAYYRTWRNSLVYVRRAIEVGAAVHELNMQARMSQARMGYRA